MWRGAPFNIENGLLAVAMPLVAACSLEQNDSLSIGDAGLSKLAEALAENFSLQRL